MSREVINGLFNTAGLSFHHFGLAVYQPGRALSFLEYLGYRIGPSVYDPLQNVNLIMCESSVMPAVELIYPSGLGGPLESILRERGELIYHLCYQSASRERWLQSMREAGIRVGMVSAPKPAVLFGGQLVSFHTVMGFGLVEILEKESAANLP